MNRPPVPLRSQRRIVERATTAPSGFGDVDGVMNLSWGDLAASPYAGSEVLDASARCAQGGDPGADPHYAVFAKNTRDTFYFHSAEPAVRAAVPALNPDPCGQLLSLSQAITADSMFLGRIDVPVLVMFGDADAVFPPPAADLLDALDRCPQGAPELSRARALQAMLAGRGQHRGVPADLLIAASAEAAEIPVLHDDHDYDLIAGVSGQQVRWVLPAGSLP